MYLLLLLEAVICWVKILILCGVFQPDELTSCFFHKKSSRFLILPAAVHSDLWAVVFQSCSSVICRIHVHTNRVWNTLTWHSQTYIHAYIVSGLNKSSTHTHTHTSYLMLFKADFVRCYIARWRLLHHFRVCNVGSIQQFDLAVFKTWNIYYCCIPLVYCNLSMHNWPSNRYCIKWDLNKSLTVFSHSVSLYFTYQTILSK